MEGPTICMGNGRRGERQSEWSPSKMPMVTGGLNTTHVFMVTISARRTARFLNKQSLSQLSWFCKIVESWIHPPGACQGRQLGIPGKESHSSSGARSTEVLTHRGMSHRIIPYPPSFESYDIILIFFELFRWPDVQMSSACFPLLSVHLLQNDDDA